MRTHTLMIALLAIMVSACASKDPYQTADGQNAQEAQESTEHTKFETHDSRVR